MAYTQSSEKSAPRRVSARGHGTEGTNPPMHAQRTTLDGHPAVIDCEQITARDPETGEAIDAVRVPDGYVLCLIAREVAEAHADWRECAAVRIVTGEDGTVGALEVAPDLEWLTSPEAQRA